MPTARLEEVVETLAELDEEGVVGLGRELLCSRTRAGGAVPVSLLISGTPDEVKRYMDWRRSRRMVATYSRALSLAYLMKRGSRM
ncbi:MAG: hypothetical protein DRJ57_04085 [Thermoprotei archaeon]|nr:MAG: hypothetical protein DRJ57_04085 [Thermoprotei archaeon]